MMEPDCARGIAQHVRDHYTVRRTTLKTRIASAVALAAALALGATGCSLIASQGTLKPYAPSDGVDVTVEGVDIRNIMLVADESGENFNIVFGAVNRTGAPQSVVINFVGEGGRSASAEVELPEGSTRFGNPDGPEAPVLVALPGVAVGSTVEAYFQAGGAPEVQHLVPVLDGTLAEYQDYVLPADFQAEDDEKTTPLEDQDTAAAESKTGDDTQDSPSEEAAE